MSEVVDNGAGEHRRPAKPCCVRLPDAGGWCLLVDGHEGEHIGRPSIDELEPADFGPNAATRRRP